MRPFRVHCMFCRQFSVDAETPGEAHAAMERHYSERHPDDIAEVLRGWS